MTDDIAEIINSLVVETGIPAWVILSRKRPERIVVLRQIAYFLARKKGYTFQDIGDVFGRHHTTIMNGVRKIKHERIVNNTLDAMIKRLEV
jgi:chromosomal replication initiation ATPase DnaA